MFSSTPFCFDKRRLGRLAARSLVAVALAAISAIAGLPRFAQADSASSVQADLPTSCANPTPQETEGPYFTAGSPEETVLASAQTPGTTLVLTGFVLDTSCRPIAGALVDFWQANASGQYDNAGYTLRGHQYTDAEGRYQVETIEPGLYPGRTRHIHVKVQAPGLPAITTQLYFPAEAGNAQDGIFRVNGQQLLMNIQPAANGSLNATFNFIVALPS